MKSQRFVRRSSTGSSETAEATVVSTAGPIINASQTMRQASIGPFNTFQLTSGGQILMNPGAVTSGSNVVRLVYHQHAAWQYANRSTSDDWWYWNTTAGAWYYFMIASVTLNTQSWTQGAAAGTVIANISVNMAANAANDTFTTFTGGTITVSGHADLAISGTNIVVANGHTATLTSYPNITVTASFPVGGQSIGVGVIGPTNSITQTVASSSNTEGIYPFLIGFQSAGMSQSYHSLVGMNPDFENDGADGTYPLFDGNGTGTWAEWTQLPFPAVLQTNSFGDSADPPGTSFNDPVAAAAGTYNNVYNTGAGGQPGLFTLLGPYAQNIYCLRLNWEWSGGGYPFSPFKTSSIGSGSFTNPWYSGDTFVKGWRQFVDTMRSDSRWNNVKIVWDYPLGWGGGPVDIFSYYPAWPTNDPTRGAASSANGGANANKTAYVDIVANDPYFGWFDGSTTNSSTSWSNRLGGSFGLTALAQFAAARGKKIGFMEWGDGYSDGVCINNFGNWLKNTVPTLGTQCVFISYFNGGNFPTSGQLSDVNLSDATKPNRLNAYKAQFGSSTMGTTYTGTYWSPHKTNTGTPPKLL